MNSSIEVYLLAAGQGTRFGGSKPLFVFDGKPVLERVVGAFQDAGLASIFVIGRPDDGALAMAATKCGAKFLVGSHPELDMAGSVLAAIENCKSDWMALCPADLPLLTPTPIRDCVAALEGDVVQPSCAGRPKHPVFLSNGLFSMVRSKLLSGHTLRDCLAEPVRRKLVESDDALQFWDMNTPSDLASMMDALGKIDPHSAE